MGKTNIDWAKATWNPIEGCAPCSPGCDRCWARGMAHRCARNQAFANDPLGDYGMRGNPYEDIEAWDGTLAEFPRRWFEPQHWRKPRRIFVGSRSDIALWPDHDVAEVLTMAKSGAPQHRYVILTKRPAMLWDKTTEPWPANCIIMATVCNQDEANDKIPALLRIPAAHYGVCLEPMLGSVDLDGIWGYPGSATADMLASWPVEWVILGGESGPGARPMETEWVRSVVRQTRQASVPLWFKQWWSLDCYGKFLPWFVKTMFGVPYIDMESYREMPSWLRLPGEVTP